MKIKTFLMIAVAAVGMARLSDAEAVTLRLEPATTTVQTGGPFSLNIVADIAGPEAIIGFGFDLQVSGSGGVTLLGFAPGPGFADDPVFLAPPSDSDGIRGASGGDLLSGPPVAGTDILLGTLLLRATSAGTALIDLDADDLNFFYTEGLIPADINLSNFMPAVTPVQVTITATAVAEPSSVMLVASLLPGLALLSSGKIRTTTSRLRRILNKNI